MPLNKHAEALQRKKFAKSLIKHNGNATQAFLDIKPNLKPASARSMVSDYLARVDISSDIREILDKEGVTDQAVASALGKMLNAQKLQDTSEGVKTVDDNTNINTAIVTALKTKGHLKDNQGQVNIQIGTSIQSADELARIERLMADAKMILGRLGYLDKQMAQEAEAHDVPRENNSETNAVQ